MGDGRAPSEAADRLERSLSPGARAEFEAMGLGAAKGGQGRGRPGIDPVDGRPPYPKRAISAPEALNEAYDYDKPSSFTRGIRVASVTWMRGRSTPVCSS